jgi:flavin-dependent dehydrogenase
VAERALFDAIILGGGPAGSAVGRLLSRWGHSVLLLDKPGPVSRSLAESLPPSTRKLLAQIGVLEAVEREGFVRATGNTVWWASGDHRVEPFGPAREAMGYQVQRSSFDRVLRDCARAAGVDVRTDARIREVRFVDESPTEPIKPTRSARRPAVVAFDEDGRRCSASGRFVLDCSGRAGLVGRRFRRMEPGYRTCALVGVWSTSAGWDLPDETHTVVETYDDGWLWSVPISEATRHVGAMVDRAASAAGGSGALESVYRAEIGKAGNLFRVLEGATLQRVWACDASLYSSVRYGGAQFLLIGDAGSFIDPLSSFGVKRALASAWLAAIAVHTSLTHPERQEVALEFFSKWEREVYANNLDRSAEFARAAQMRHPHPFWASRAAAGAEPEDRREREQARDPDVQAAFDRFKHGSSVDLMLAADVRVEPRPVIRDHEIVLEDAFVDVGRFSGNVDLVKLADIACRHTGVPDVFEDYCRSCGRVPLPNVVSGLSLLVAKGILHDRA